VELSAERFHLITMLHYARTVCAMVLCLSVCMLQTSVLSEQLYVSYK